MKLSEDNRLKANNIKGLFSNPQTKPIIIITGALLVGMIGIAIFKQGRTADEDVPAAASVNGAPAVEHQPGVNERESCQGVGLYSAGSARRPLPSQR